MKWLLCLTAACVPLAWLSMSNAQTTGPLRCAGEEISCPVEGGCLQKGAGAAFQRNRRSPVDGVVRNHNGTDYIASTGANILSAANGVIERSYSSTTFGNTVIIRHLRADGSRGGASLYAHLQRSNVAVGDAVRSGQIIGQANSTGRSTGSHLHMEYVAQGAVVKSPNRIDPDACIRRPDDFSGRWLVENRVTVTSGQATCGAESFQLPVVFVRESDTRYVASAAGQSIVLTRASTTDPNGLTGSAVLSFPEDGGTTVSNISVRVPTTTSLVGSTTWRWSNPAGLSCAGTATFNGVRG